MPVANVTHADLDGQGPSVPRRGHDPLLPPTWAVCSPLCSRVMPAGLIELHRDVCARFARYIDGALQGRWATWA